MSALYLDTSALARVLLQEPDAPIIEREMGRFAQRVSSHVLGVELRRVARREKLLSGAELLLARLYLQPIDEDVLVLAGRIEPQNVATLDAIHLATAVTLAADGDVDAMLTYDLRLADAARHHGIDVLSPA